MHRFSFEDGIDLLGVNASFVEVKYKLTSILTASSVSARSTNSFVEDWSSAKILFRDRSYDATSL